VVRDNFCQRYWFGWFCRKTCIVSRYKQMVDLTMSLFACFRVNGTPDMIASFLSQLSLILKVLFKLCYVVGEIYAIVIEQTIGSLRHYLCGFMRWTRLFLMFVYG